MTILFSLYCPRPWCPRGTFLRLAESELSKAAMRPRNEVSLHTAASSLPFLLRTCHPRPPSTWLPPVLGCTWAPWHWGSAPLAFPDCSYSMHLALRPPFPTCDDFHGNFLRREVCAVVPLPIRDSESGQQGFLPSFPSCGVFVNHLLIIYDNGLQ